MVAVDRLWGSLLLHVLMLRSRGLAVERSSILRMATIAVLRPSMSMTAGCSGIGVE